MTCNCGGEFVPVPDSAWYRCSTCGRRVPKSALNTSAYRSREEALGVSKYATSQPHDPRGIATKELDKLTNLICSIQQGMDPRVVKALIERMHG